MESEILACSVPNASEVKLLSDTKEIMWEMEPHTKVKHEILQNYLEAWFPILSSASNRIIYLDGFAGPGIYKGGEHGSPVIALKTALGHKLRPLFKEILFIFIEKDKERAAKLKGVLLDQFPKLPPNIKYEVIGSEFAPTLASTLESLEKEGAQLAPTFAFLDPFGFSGLPMMLIARMMNYDKCEVLITFMEGFVNRFTDEKREPVLNELYACEDWKRIREIRDPKERETFLLELYEKQLKNVAGAEHVASFGIIGRHNQPIYYLVFGTKHWKGLQVMKEAMFRVDKRGTYKFSDFTDVNQTFLIDYGSEDHWVPAAAEAVYTKFRGRTVSKNEILKFVVTETRYLYRKSILEHLEKHDPPRIVNVTPPRKRRYSYPDGCSITFS